MEPGRQQIFMIAYNTDLRPKLRLFKGGADYKFVTFSHHLVTLGVNDPLA